MRNTISRLAGTFAVFCAALLGCLSQLTPVDTPLTLTPPPGATPDTHGRGLIEGVYVVSAGSGTFGDSLVVRWVKDRLCLYSGMEVIFAEMASGASGDTVRFAGYYRFVRSNRTGSIAGALLPDEGGASLRTQQPAASVRLRGTIQEGSSSHDLLLTRVRPFALDSTRFQIIGNCAGGRNSERLGRSENSIEMAKFAATLGCTGIEIDLHVTQDSVVILMHDDTFTPRTVDGTYLLGPIANFTLRQIRTYSRLVDGEVLPTLDEFLKAVIDSTDLELVWLDPKVSVCVPKMIEAQRRWRVYARDSVSRSHPIEILLGLPSIDIYDAYLASPNAHTEPVLCELDPSQLDPVEAKVWAPRWTNGPQPEVVSTERVAAHRRVIPWTIDSPDYMLTFLRQAKFDGMLSDYPSMLTGLYYQFGNPGK